MYFDYFNENVYFFTITTHFFANNMPLLQLDAFFGTDCQKKSIL